MSNHHKIDPIEKAPMINNCFLFSIENKEVANNKMNIRYITDLGEKFL